MPQRQKEEDPAQNDARGADGLALLQQSSISAGEVATRGGDPLSGVACRGVSRPSKVGRSDPESALPRTKGTSRSHALVGARS